jgi:hypothetical protein
VGYARGIFCGPNRSGSNGIGGDVSLWFSNGLSSPSGTHIRTKFLLKKKYTYKIAMEVCSEKVPCVTSVHNLSHHLPWFQAASNSLLLLLLAPAHYAEESKPLKLKNSLF